jgi:hypothetical protein
MAYVFIDNRVKQLPKCDKIMVTCSRNKRNTNTNMSATEPPNKALIFEVITGCPVHQLVWSLIYQHQLLNIHYGQVTVRPDCIIIWLRQDWTGWTVVGQPAFFAFYLFFSQFFFIYLFLIQFNRLWNNWAN